MIRIEDIKVGSVLQITKGNLIKIAGPVFADKIVDLAMYSIFSDFKRNTNQKRIRGE